jgi:hypothetical protein
LPCILSKRIARPVSEEDPRTKTKVPNAGKDQDRLVAAVTYGTDRLRLRRIISKPR